MIDRLIERAEAAGARFDQLARKAIVVEFAGVPKAGKTSTIGQMVAFFKRCGFRVEVVVERASVCPIRDKKHSNFNVWTACTTLAQLLEKTQDPPRADDPQILILDRGLFDSLVWFRMMERLSRIRPADRERIESFLLIDDWRKKMSGVIVMSASPRDSMERERGQLPVPGATGSIMNPAVLEQVRKTTEDVTKQYKDKFRTFVVDTSAPQFRNNPKKTCEVIADTMLNWIEEQLVEDILHVPKKAVEECFEGKSFLVGSKAEQVLELFRSDGQFRPRDEVEQDATLVQALPIAVVRNKTGDVLRLRRRETSDSNPLHEKLVLWAGGHVRKEDATNGDPVEQSLLRELHEELRLDIERESLRLLGAIYVDTGDRTSKHVALVYEWRANTDDVAVSLSSAEFFERRGTALSGRFMSPAELVKDVDRGKVSEVWSTEIARNLLADTSQKLATLMF